MPPVLYYLVALHVILKLRLYFTSPGRESSDETTRMCGSSCLRGKKKGMLHDILSSGDVLKKTVLAITTFKCKAVWIETTPDVFVVKVKARLSLS